MNGRLAAGIMVAATLAVAGCQAGGMGTVGALQGQNRTASSYLAEIRSSNGLSALSADSTLEAAAKQQARYMAGAGKMAHTTGFGKAFGRRMNGNGIEGPAAENIAHGAFGPDELFRRWMNSPGHRRNMLNPTYTRYGLASAADDNGRKYWALVLAQ